MIKIVDSNNPFLREIAELSKGNPYGCRIMSIYNTYNYNLPFVDFWVQFIEGKPVSLISRLESAFIMRLSEESDMDEISSFARVSGAGSVICDASFGLKCNLSKKSGPILYSDKLFDISKSFEVYSPDTKEVYSVICKSASENFAVPSYESFMLDVNHKLNQRSIRMYAVKEDKAAACIMTLAESKDSAVLGALATDPDYRHKGYGAFLIKYINNVLVSEGKRVYLHRAPSENVAFYNKLGFKEYGKWAEYRENKNE